MNKWIYSWVIQGYYEGRWEDLTAHPIRASAILDLKAYRENEKGSFRMIQRRELNKEIS